jgi:hypothetical protein
MVKVIIEPQRCYNSLLCLKMNTIGQLLNDLTQRVIALEKFRADEEASFETEIGVQIRAFTRVQALEIVVMELAVHLGIPEPRVKQRLEELQRKFHDQHLQNAELLNSGFAARIDDRDLHDVPTDQGEGRLFPPKSD